MKYRSTAIRIQLARLSLLAFAGAVLISACAVSPEALLLGAREDLPAEAEASTPLPPGAGPQGAQPQGSVPAAVPWNPKRHITDKLGLPSRFLLGLGNDVASAEDWDPNRAHAFDLGQKLDIHYLYLAGLDWPTWNSPEGAFVTIHAAAAKVRDVIPMFTLYQAAARGENNLGAFADISFMTDYWRGVRVMYNRLGELGSPAIVHLEPDLWGYFQNAGDDPSSVPVKVGSLVPECAGMPEDASGFGKCLVKLARTFAPKAVVGLSASAFGAYTDDGASDPERIVSYLNKVGSIEADFMAVETLDRDAGCFERGMDPKCKRSGSFYWTDDTFRSHLAWAKTIHVGTGKALLWWQMPLGVPSNNWGFPGRYRDNRVQWLFSHPQEFAEAGGVGAVFGTGAENQTTVKSDGGQFKRAVKRYYQSAIWF